MKGCVIVCFAVLLVCVNGLPMLVKSTSDRESFPAVNGFLKVAYSRIEEADVKSLTLSMLQSYRELCAKYGMWTVSRELRMIYDSHNVDVKLSAARLGKLGSLLMRLEAEAADEEDDGDDGVDSNRMVPGLRQRALPI